MVKRRAIIAMMLFAPVILVASGCMNFRLPAIDPSGRRIFLPNPNYTTVAPDAPLSRLLHGRANPLRGIGNALPQPGPYEPALFNKHRERLSQMLQHNGSFLREVNDRIHGLGSGLANHFRHDRPGSYGNNSQFNAPAFRNTPEPPLCGPDGLGPNGSPCYPIGSPSPSSLAATLPGNANRIGSGLANPNGGCQTGCNSQLANADVDPGYATGTNQPFGLRAGPQLSTQQVALTRMAQYGPGVVLSRPNITARVGEEVVVVGGIQSATGIARPGEPVQWSLSNNSVGTMVDALRPAPMQRRLLGFLHRTSTNRTQLGGCGNCLKSLTSPRCDVLTRNPIDPTDDISLSRGQSWVSLTSGSEGTSYVTLSAPQLQGRRTATATIEWIDANWDCPKPVLTTMEGPGRLITKVCRNSDKRPLADWIVRHTVLDGPAAGFGNSDSQTADVRTNADGYASVDLFPLAVEQGATRVGIQIIDPEHPDRVVGQCLGYVTWSEGAVAGQVPQVPSPTTFPPARPPTYPSSPSDNGPPFEPAPRPTTQPSNTQAELAIAPPTGPPTASIGERVPYRVVVRNNSDAAVARDVQMRTTVPAGMRILGARPQWSDNRGNEYLWALGDIPPRQPITVDIQYEAIDAGPVSHRFDADAENAPRVNNGIRTDVTGNALELSVTPSSPPRVGQIAPQTVRVNNRTGRPMNIDLMVDRWSPGLEPITDGSPANSQKGIIQEITLPPGPSDPIELPFRAIQPGPQEFRVTATDESGESDTQVVPINVLPEVQQQPTGEPGLDIAINGPGRMREGTKERFILTFKNTGKVPLNNVKVVVKADTDLELRDATPGFAASTDGTELTWLVEKIPPGFGNTIEVVALAKANPINRGSNLQVAVVSAEGFGEQTFAIEFVEGPDDGRRSAQKPVAGDDDSLQLNLSSNPRSVRVGETIDFVVTVINENPNGYRDVQVSMEVAEGMEFTKAVGPPATRSSLRGNGLLLDFSSILEIMPRERLQFRATVVAKKAGVAKMLGRVHAIGISKPLIVYTEAVVK